MTVPVSEVMAGLVAVVRGTDLPAVGSAEDLRAWAGHNSDELTDLLHAYGAVLLRGLPVGEPAEFAAVAEALSGPLRPYVDGTSPRSSVGEGVYTSTEYPSEYPISLHQELSYACRWPARVFFYCARPAESGGETLLASGEVPLRALDPAVVDSFRASGVRYLRTLHGGRGPGRSWQETFETADRAAVERYLADDAAEFTWLPGGGLRVSQQRVALRRHPVTGTEVWFNQVDQWHPSNLDATTRRALESVFRPDELPLNACLGDGRPLEEDALDTLRAAFRDAAVPVAWQRHDLLMIDNMLLAHGRAPFRGDRRVLVGMA